MEYEEAKQKIYKLLEDFVFIPLLQDNMEDGIALIKEETACDNNTAKLIWYDIKRDYGTKENNPILQVREQYKTEQSHEKLNVPKCPICNSTNLSKITTTKKIVKIAAFGIFGMGDNGKTWKCNKCGSKF